jgi:hypothetical protein
MYTRIDLMRRLQTFHARKRMLDVWVFLSVAIIAVSSAVLKRVSTLYAFSVSSAAEYIPFRWRNRKMSKFVVYSWSLVVGLCLCVRPSAVAGEIPFVVFDPINAETNRSFSHVFQKSKEVVAPFIADGNASTAIVFESFTVFVVTALEHPYPNSICTVFRFSTLRIVYTLKTSCGSTVTKTTGQNDSLSSTIAFTEPRCCSSFLASVTDDDKFMKSLPGQIDGSGNGEAFESASTTTKRRSLFQGIFGNGMFRFTRETSAQPKRRLVTVRFIGVSQNQPVTETFSSKIVFHRRLTNKLPVTFVNVSNNLAAIGTKATGILKTKIGCQIRWLHDSRRKNENQVEDFLNRSSKSSIRFPLARYSMMNSARKYIGRTSIAIAKLTAKIKSYSTMPLSNTRYDNTTNRIRPTATTRALRDRFMAGSPV